MTEAEITDQRFKTIRHIETVRNMLNEVIRELLHRQEQHDQSKLQSPEREMFDKWTGKLRGVTYGSEEYKGFIREMRKDALAHHYEHNRHHPEHFVMWQCVVCKQVFNDSEKYTGPHDDDGKTYYCPNCCEHGMIYECSLERCQGIFGMDLIDVIEMFCDWYAAGKRHNDGDIYKSIEINAESKLGNSKTLKQIFINTADWITKQKVYHHADES